MAVSTNNSKTENWWDQTFSILSRPGLMASVWAMLDFDSDALTLDSTLLFAPKKQKVQKVILFFMGKKEEMRP